MSTSIKTLWENYRFSIILIISITIGSIIGLILGERAVVLKPFGDIFLNLMFTAVTPLVFVTIASAVGSMVNMRRLGKILGNMALIFVITGLFAAILIIFVVKIYPPAEGVNIQLENAGELEKLSFGNQVVSAVTVNDFSKILSRSNMLPLIVFSILFGYCVSAAGGEDNMLAKALDALSKVMMKFISLIMIYAPIGLGAYFASLIGEFGPQLLGAYARAMIVYYPLCIFYFFVFFALYTYYSGGMEAVKSFFRNIVEASITSIATQSSIATLPAELRSAQRIGVPKDIRDIILPIGATAHMDGTVLSSILKISFLFGVFGMEFSGIGTYLTAIGLSILGGVVMSGIPGGGLIGEMLIVNMYGFPPEAFPIIATIGFLVDPPATWLNSTGDTVASMMVTRIIEGKDWMAKKLTANEEIL